MLFAKRSSGSRRPLRPLVPEPPVGDKLMLPVDAVVEGIYSALLSRPPTPREQVEGEALIQRDGSPVALANTIVNRKAFHGRVADVRARFGLSEDRLINDGSQNGEVELLLKQIVNKACPTRTIVDAGARGRNGSNSYDLMRYLGWRGLLIEANPDLIAQLRLDFAGLDCVVESCAVSDYDGEATFTLGINDDVSSLSPEQAGLWGPTNGEVMVPVHRLGTLLERHKIPQAFDVLSLDIEGQDVKVLNDLVENTAYRPRWIILEGPSGGFENRLDQIECSPRVIDAYQVVANTIANLILESRADAPDRP